MIDLMPIRPGQRVTVSGLTGEVTTVQRVTDFRLVIGLRTDEGVIERCAIDLADDARVLSPPTTVAETDVLAHMVVAGCPPRMPAARVDMILATAWIGSRPNTEGLVCRQSNPEDWTRGSRRTAGSPDDGGVG